MKLRKNLVLTLFCCLLVLLLVGCSKENLSKPNSINAAGSYSVTDVTGTKLTFAEKPKRIVSMSVGVDEILLDMLAPTRIMAVTYLADDQLYRLFLLRQKLCKEELRVTALRRLWLCSRI